MLNKKDEQKGKELLQRNAEDLLENSEMVEIKGGKSEMVAIDEGSCHGNGCNETCKKKQ